MERHQFLATMSTAIAAATALATIGAATPMPVQTAPPSSSHWTRRPGRSDRNIRRVRAKLEKLIDELSHDDRDYGGHRERALDLLHQARQELQAAEQYDAQHPNG